MATYSGWWFGSWMLLLFFHSVGNFIIPTDKLLFFRGVGFNHQPMLLLLTHFHLLKARSWVFIWRTLSSKIWQLIGFVPIPISWFSQGVLPFLRELCKACGNWSRLVGHDDLFGPLAVHERSFAKGWKRHTLGLWSSTHFESLALKVGYG